MVGRQSGFATKLMEALNKEDTTLVHRCLAHRIELALNAPIKKGKCTNCQKLDTNLKLLSAFYHRSPKRLNSLAKYFQANGNGRTFTKPKRIHNIRWVASHFMAAKKLYINWDIFVGHLMSIESDPEFHLTATDRNTREEAQLLVDVLLQRNFLVTLATQMDTQYVFKGVSELFQQVSFLGKVVFKIHTIANMLWKLKSFP